MSLKSFLTRLIWLCVVPLLLAASWLAFENVHTARTERDIEAANLARNLATAIDQHLTARIGALSVLAASPLADDASRRPDLYREAQGFRASFGAHVILADPEMNMLFNTRVPFGTALPVMPRPKGRAAAPAALETGAAAVGDVFFGPIAGEALVAIAVPGQREGKTRFLLLGIFETRQFQQRLDQLALPDGWSIALQDGTGAAIARRAPPGLNAATDVDAAGRFVVKSALAPWSVVLEIPRDVYRAPLLATTAALALLILGATLAGVLGGQFASRRLAKSVASLVQTPAPGAPLPEIAEIATVRGLLDSAAEQRVSADAARRASDARIRSVFEQANDGIYIISAENRYLDANPRGLELLGYTRDELLRMGVADVLAPDEVARLAVEPPRMMSGIPHLAEWQHVRKDGSTFPGEVSARRLDEHSYLAIVRDLSERRRLEEERRQIFERITDAFVALDKDWRYTFVNPKAALMFGRRAEDLIGKHIWTEFPEGLGQRFHLAYEKAMAEQQAAILEEYYPPYERWFENRIYPSPEGLTIYFHDITERKRAEEALGESRARLEALTRRLLDVQETERRAIARELHDEVGGVLTAVKLNLQALRRAHTAAQSEAALTDGLALVDGAIQSVRSLSLDLRPAVLDDLGLIPALKWYCERQAQRAGVAIELALDAIDLKAAPQLESACFRIVQEAVTNALRHAGALRIQVTLRREDGRFAIAIADDGGGFDVAAARRRGLAGESSGVPGMEERAMLLGGRLSIDSAPGAGTRVRAEFVLPDGGLA